MKALDLNNKIKQALNNHKQHMNANLIELDKVSNWYAKTLKELGHKSQAIKTN